MSLRRTWLGSDKIMLIKWRLELFKIFILTVKYCYDALKYIVRNCRKREAQKGMKAIKFITLGSPLTQAIQMCMKNSVLAHKLDLKSSHAADVDLLSVEYQLWPWISFNNVLPKHYSYL